jgi:hypothetical protein
MAISVNPFSWLSPIKKLDENQACFGSKLLQHFGSGGRRTLNCLDNDSVGWNNDRRATDGTCRLIKLNSHFNSLSINILKVPHGSIRRLSNGYFL